MSAHEATRLSHAYCSACDVVFPASPVCPRCRRTLGLIGPPRDSTVTPQPIDAINRRKGREWIGRDTKAAP